MKKFWSTITGINVIAAIVVVNVLLTFLPNLQIDLTKDKLHSLSAVSKQTIHNLNDVVNIRVYETTDLPTQIKPIASDLNVILKELANLNKSKLIITIVDPSKDDNAKAEVQKYGIQTLQFSSIKSDTFAVQTGYFGLVMLYNNKQTVLPVVSDVGNLEYFIVSGIKKLTSSQLSGVAIAEDTGGSTTSSVQYLQKYLARTYDVSEATLDGDTKFPDSASTLIISGRSTKIDDKGIKKIEDWVNSGKGLITFLDRINVSSNMQASKNPETGLEKIFADKGMQIEDKLVIDDNSTIANFQTNNGSFLVKYPYWPQIKPENINSSLPVMSGITSLNLAWASPIEIENNKVQTLFTSSEKTQLDDSLNDLSPIAKKSAAGVDQKKYVLGAIRTDGVKMALIGNEEMIKDNFVINNQQNLLMALNLVDYFSQDSSLMAIRAKILKDSPLISVSDQTKMLVRWGNVVAPLMLLIISFGISAYVRKKKIQKWHRY
jgi:ABC-type uncharacterized transport system involved in gliding motility auxiliary subunit